MRWEELAAWILRQMSTHMQHRTSPPATSRRRAISRPERMACPLSARRITADIEALKFVTTVVAAWHRRSAGASGARPSPAGQGFTISQAGPSIRGRGRYETKWRSEWDSNPRASFNPATRFPVVLLRPTRTSLLEREIVTSAPDKRQSATRLIQQSESARSATRYSAATRGKVAPGRAGVDRANKNLPGQSPGRGGEWRVGSFSCVSIKIFPPWIQVIGEKTSKNLFCSPRGPPLVSCQQDYFWK